MGWQDVRKALDEGSDVLVLPIGSLEQHGPHMPLITDSLMVTWVANHAAAQTPGVLVAPTLTYGVSHNHIDFPGTATLRVETMKNLIKDVGHTLLGHGFKVLVLLNGHGGNNATVAVSAIELRQETGKIIANIYTPALVKNAYKALECEINWHADEGETATMLVAAPELVDMTRAVREIPKPIPLFEFTEEALSSSMVDIGLPKTKDITRSGTIGDATLATRAKGQLILDESVANLVTALKDLQAGSRQREKTK
jgi:creatinine amidohydrolase